MYLYFIKAGNAIKVGVTEDLKKRICELQVGNPIEMELLHAIGLSPEKAQKLETEIHRLFQKTNLHGEWFQSTTFMSEYIENIKENGLEHYYSWIDKRYQDDYGKILRELRAKVERDVIIGNLISLEKLESELM